MFEGQLLDCRSRSTSRTCGFLRRIDAIGRRAIVAIASISTRPLSTGGQGQRRLKDPLESCGARRHGIINTRSASSEERHAETRTDTEGRTRAVVEPVPGALLDTLPVMIWTGRADGSGIDFVSRPFLDYTGLETAQVLGWGWTDTVHPDDRERLIECVDVHS